MFKFRTPGAMRRARVSAPRLETLEPRQLLTVSVGDASSSLSSQSIWQAPAWAALTPAAVMASPSVTGSEPSDGKNGVARNAFVAAYVNLPNVGHGVSESTLASSNVKLYRSSDKASVSAVLNTTGGGDAIILTPKNLLDANTNYTFEVTSGLTDTSGAAFQPFKISFTTGTITGIDQTNIAFDKVSLSNATGHSFTGVTVGPDNRLYAGTMTGEILRWDINSDGTLSNTTTINTVKNGNGGANRLVTGLRFDPTSTAGNLILWVTHGYGTDEGAPDWTGKLSRLTGSSLSNYQDYVTGLPRSIRDHLTNQIDFDSQNRLYISQGSMTAMGAPDNAWGQRGEHLLSAAILRVDYNAIATRIANGQGAVNVKTEGSNPYDPYATGAPVILYATGVRNAYDILWHSNGNLYAPTNGSAPGGNTPAGGGAPALNNVSQVESDWLFKIRKDKYYGHPNPSRGEYVLNGGNPTSSSDKYQVNAYPVGVKPDADWDPAIYSFGANYSPDGIIEYKSAGPFGGALKGSMLIARYSGGDDVIIMTPDASGNIPSSGGVKIGAAGLTGFTDPLDIAEQVGPGYLYVVEHGANKITLLRPKGGSSTPPTSGQSLNDISWTTNAPGAPMTRNEPGAVQVGNKLYVLGGYNGVFDRQITFQCDVYDLATRKWSSIAPLPSNAGTTHAGVASDGKYIYVVAGQVGGAVRHGIRDAFRYDIANNKWEDFVDLPEVRFGGALTYLNGKLHFFGGSAADRVSVQTTHWELDLSNPGAGWITKAPLPLGGDHIARAVLNGKIYAIGGEHDHGGLVDTTDAKYIQHNYLFEYDPATDHWTRKADMNVGTSHNEGMVQVIAGQIVVIGGMIKKDTPTDLVRAYDPVANSWRTLPQRLIVSKLGAVTGQYNGKIYMTEGVEGDRQHFTVTGYEGTIKLSNVTTPTPTPPPTPTPTPTGPGHLDALTLVNADNDQPIGPFESGTTINYPFLPTHNVTVRAEAGGAIGSVRWGLDDNATYSLENYAPYAVGGDQNGGDLLPFNVPLGAHTLTVTAYDGKDGTGNTIRQMSMQFYVSDVQGSINALTLVNADNDKPIGPFENNTTINYAALSTKAITVRAETSGAIGSVRWGLDGNADYHDENFAPYAIGGDQNTTDLLPFNIATGTHTLTVTAFSGVDGTGSVLSTQTLTFHVADVPVGTPPQVGTPPGPIAGLTLMNADTDQPIGPFENNTTISFAAIGTHNVTVRAETGGSIGSMQWGLDGNPNFSTENFAPYAIGGDQNVIDLLPLSLSLGQHTLSVTAFSGPDATGSVLGSIANVTFYVADVP